MIGSFNRLQICIPTVAKKSHFSRIFLLFLLLLSGHCLVFAQVWLENFSGAPPAPGWNQAFIDCDGTAASFAGVRNGRFEVQDMEGNCCAIGGGDNDGYWTTNPIDISMSCNVSVQASYGSIGVLECVAGGPYFGCITCNAPSPPTCITDGHDQMLFEYRKDGGPWIQFGYVCGNGMGTFNSGPIGAGMTVEIRINAANKSVAETYWFDNVQVLGTVAPVMNPVADLTVCAGQPIVANFTPPGGGVTYSWTNSNTLIGLPVSSTGNINIPSSSSITSTQTSTITVTPRIGACIGMPQTFMVTVVPGPPVDPVGPFTVCSGSQIQVGFSSTSTTAVYNWTNNNVNTGIPANGSGNIDVPANIVAANQTSIISVRANESGCIGPPRSVQVTVRPLPTANQPASLVRCAGQNATINFTGTGTPVYEWTNDNPAVGLAGNGTGNINFTTAAPSGTQQVANITVTPRNGTCVGTPQTFTVTVNAPPTVMDPPDITVCPGNAIDVMFSGSSANSTYTWTNTNAAIGVPTSGSGNIMAIATGGVNPIIGVFTVRAVENTCIGLPQNFSVVVTPAPVVSTISNVTRCPGQSVTISFGGTAGATFEWANSNTNTGLSAATGTGNINFTAANVATPQVANITVTPKLGSCPGTPQNFTITITPGPSMAKPPDRTFCANDSIRVAFSGASPTATYTWNNSNTAIGIGVSGTGNIKDTAAVVVAAQTGTFTVRASENGCTGAPQNFNITVAPPPSVSQPANATACSGQTIGVAFAGSSGAVFNWTNNNTTVGLVASGTGNLNFVGTNTGITPQTATVTVIPAAGTCSGTPRTFTIIVNPVPSVVKPVDLTLCQNNPVNITFSGSSPTATYTWINNNTAIGIGASGSGNIAGTAATVTTAQTGVITITPTENSCPGTPQNFNITVAPPPSILQPVNVTVCAGQNVNVAWSGSTGATFNWANSNTNIGLSTSGSGNLNFTGTNTGNTPQTASITATPVAGSCSGTAVTFTVVINPSPTLVQPANLSFCDNNPITVTFSGSSPTTTYTWNNNNTAIGIGASGSGNIAGTATAMATIQTGIITVTPVENGCTGTPKNFNITVLPPPFVSQPANSTVCAGQNIGVVFAGSTGTVFNWINSNTAIGLGASGSGNLTFTGTNAGTMPQTATITVTPIAGTCPGTPRTFTIIVTPIATVDDPADVAVCSGAAVVVNFTGTAGSYNWLNSNTAIGLAASGTGNINFNSATNGTSTLIVTPAGSGCTGPSQTFVISITNALTMNPVANINRCGGDTVRVTFSGTPGATYQWSNSNTTIGLGLTGTGNLNFVGTTPGTLQTATITVTPIAGTCSGTPTTFNITVRPGIATAITGIRSVCSGNSTTLTATTGNTFLWNGGQTTQSVTISPTSNTNFVVTATDATGCTASATALVRVNPTNGVTLLRTTCNPVQVGIKTETFQNQFGCDSVVTTLTNLSPTDTIRFSRKTCNPAQAGVNTLRLTNRFGCDSLIITTTTLSPTDTMRLSKTTCNPVQAGIVSQRLTNRFGCDSLIITTTRLLLSDTTRISRITCNPLNAGTATQRLTQTNGCDSLVIVTTTFDAAGRDTTQLTARTCNPLVAGTTQRLLKGSDGCDSLVITTTTLSPRDTVRLSRTTCNPTQAGTNTLRLTNRFGCDSLVITTTTLSPRDTVRLSRTTCNPTQAGTNTLRLTNRFGCDSLVITTTSLSPTDTTRVQRISCNPANAGVRVQKLIQTNGCDSVVIVTTLFDPSGRDTTVLSRSTCNPTQAGTTQNLLMGSSGCDSLVITVTTLSRRDTIRLSRRTCNPVQAGIVSQLLTNRFGCDSLVITTTTLSPRDTLRLSRTTCNLAQAGINTLRLINRFGCDSLVITTTAFLVTDTTRISRVSCNPANAGIRTQKLTQTNGCDSMLIITTVFDPAGRDTTVLLAKTCDPAKVGLTQKPLIGSSGCDSLVLTITTLSPRDTIRLSRSTCNPAQAGINTVRLLNRFGCDSLVVTTTALLPKDTVRLSRATCNPTQAGTTTQRLTNRFGCDSLVITTTALLRKDTTLLSNATCDPTQAGTATRRLSNRLGCDSLVITTITYSAAQCVAQAVLSSRPATCADRSDGSATFTVNGGVPPFGYTWTNSAGGNGSGQIAALNTPVTVPNLPPGPFNVTISQPNIPGGATYVINIPAPGPIVAQAIATLTAPPFAFRCAGTADGTANVMVNGGIGPYQYAWSNNIQTPVATNLRPGNYTITVTDQNRCTAVAAVILRAPDPIALAVQVSLPQCGDILTDGFVSISGGAAPFFIKVNNNFTPDRFVQLGNGNNLIEITDRNGCIADTTIRVTIPPAALLYLPSDTIIRLGQALTLTALTNLSPGAIDKVIWSPLPDSTGLLSKTWKPLKSGVFTVTLFDTAGCRIRASTTVIVRSEVDIFVPNIFSPNVDGIHDILTISASEGVKDLELLRIFDRWGNMAYEWTEAIPPNLWPGWDGKMGGKNVAPGVYVYYLKARLENGTLVEKAGGVTVVR